MPGLEMSQTAPGYAAFVVPAEGYDRLVGRYLPTLAPEFANAAGVGEGMRVLDVGCGPGGLTRELVARVGADAVAAIDPSPPFVEACRVRLPGVDVQVGVAEQLPYPHAAFDATLACLVVGFMDDAATGVRDMARVTHRRCVLLGSREHASDPGVLVRSRDGRSVALRRSDQAGQ